MMRHTLKILQHFLQHFLQRVPDHLGTFYIKGLNCAGCIRKDDVMGPYSNIAKLRLGK